VKACLLERRAASTGSMKNHQGRRRFRLVCSLKCDVFTFTRCIAWCAPATYS
jgi:hypothetical protein